jgi:nitrile hydratase accessory protein
VTTMPALLPDQPQDDDGPVFAEPWQAQAFAMVLALHKKGVFTWSEWGQALGARIAAAKAAGDPDLGDTYYLHWFDTLERLVAGKGLSSAAELSRYLHAWSNAAARTPHGRPIDLQPGDFGDPSAARDRSTSGP